jgi:hypothetical protein
MPGGSVTKLDVHTKKWTYIARKQNTHLTTKQHVHLTKKQHISQHFTVQYKCNEQNTMTSSGIEPANFQLLVLCLNKLRYRVPKTLFRNVANSDLLHVITLVFF